MVTPSKNKTLVIYHGKCTDGWTSAWAAWKKFGDSADYVPASYQSGETFDVDGRDVFILDYCPRTRQEVENIANRASSLVVLDHHLTSTDSLKGFEGESKINITLDFTRSGAGISWDYFHPHVLRPLLVNYVEDNDIWKHEMIMSKAVTTSIFSYPHDEFETWSKLSDTVETNLQQILAEGSALLRAQEVALGNVKRSVVRMDIFGHKNIPVINASSGVNISELLHQLCEDKFSVSWHQMADSRFKYSLRSAKDFDVTKIAEVYGGGGHKNASGFVSEKTPWELGYRTFKKF